MVIEKNRVVSIQYTLASTKGEILDSSSPGEPLEYLHGNGNILPGLEAALEGKKAGDAVKVTVPPEEGYGLRDESLLLDVDKSRFDANDKLEAGMEFSGQTEDGNYRIFKITAVEGNTVKIDGNHPLAGQTLTFDVKIEGIREATREELAHGHLHSEGGCGGGCDCSGDGCGEGGCCGH